MNYAVTLCLLVICTWVAGAPEDLAAPWKKPCKGPHHCPSGWECDYQTGQCCNIYPTCDLQCGPDEHCELKTVYCIRAPCPKVPTCVPGNETPCDVNPCIEPDVCINSDGNCVCIPPADQQPVPI